MQKDRFIVDDFDEARSKALNNNFKVFTLLYADDNNNSYYFRKHLMSYLTLFHVNRDVKFFENVVRSEGIELVFTGTDFGLKEMMLNKIK